MSVRLSAQQMLAAARKAKAAQVSPGAASATHQSASAGATPGPAPLSAEEAEELQQYLPRTFAIDESIPASLPHPLSHYALSAPAGVTLPAGAFIVPDFVSGAEERELLSLVGASPSCMWTTLKRRSLQMWGGYPPAGAEAEFVPTALPAWQTQLVQRLVAQGVCPAAPLAPNHVLLNRYSAGEGIMAHQDGPLYDSRVCILSLGSHTVMHFYERLSDSLPGEQHRPAFSVFLPAKSLFLFSQQLYTRMFHAIEERTEDVLDSSVLNVPAELVGQTVQRQTRISLTIRRVHTLAERKAAQQAMDASSNHISSGVSADISSSSSSNTLTHSSTNPSASANANTSTNSSSTGATAISDAAVPVIDISALLDPNDAAGRLRVSREIFDACTTSGFFYISSHGIPVELQTRLERLSRAFFALPLERKMRISMDHGGAAWRGYFPCYGELTSGKPDLKEGLYLGTELPPSHPLVAASTPLHGANLFPDDDLPELRPTVLEYIDRVTQLANRVMEGIALGLGLDADYFRRHYTSDPTVLFRIFQYPEHESAALDADSYGVGEHTDYGVLTILRQDNSGGLQVKSPSAGWIQAPPIENTFVCNMSVQRPHLTRGALPAGSALLCGCAGCPHALIASSVLSYDGAHRSCCHSLVSRIFFFFPLCLLSFSDLAVATCWSV